jgi:hypothetical protein
MAFDVRNLRAHQFYRWTNCMRRSTLLVCLLLVFSWAVASPEVLSVGDRVFIQARVIGCGDSIRNVEVGEVLDSGNVVLFGDITLEVLGKSPEQVTEMVTDAIEEKSGYRPTSIEVERVPEADDRLSVMLMLELYQWRQRGCRMRLWRNWQQPVNQDGYWHIVSASHNE